MPEKCPYLSQGREKKKTWNKSTPPSLCPEAPRQYTAKVEHRQKTFCYNTHSHRTWFLSSPCDPAYTPTKSQTAPSNKIQRPIPLLFHQEHSVLSFLTRALNSIYIFNKWINEITEKNTLTDALRITVPPTSRKSRGGNHSKKSSSVLQRHSLNMAAGCVCHGELQSWEEPWFCFKDVNTTIFLFWLYKTWEDTNIFSCFPSSFLLNFWHQDNLI